MDEKQLYDVLKVDDLMNRLGIGKNRAYQLLRCKDFPSTRIGRSYFISEKSFEDWLERNAGRTINLL